MHIRGTVLACLALTMVVLLSPALAQDATTPFTPEQLDQIVAPIALHPDALVAQLLMASTYPLEVVQAARFVKANPNLTGEPLNEALRQKTWDDSVKSLATFPQVLAMMNEKLDWLQKLGDAFLAQQQDVLAAIQRLRSRAQAEGQLKSTPEQNVTVEPAASPATSGSTTVVQAAPTVIKIEPTNPEVIYVPSYNPAVVYGAWPPAYPPYSPYPYGAFAAGAFSFMAGVAVGGALWGNADWNNGDININNQRVNNFSNNVNNRQEARNRVEQRSQNRTAGAGGGDGSRWQHNPEHRKGAQYRDSGTQQRFDRAGPANAQSREAFRGRAQSGDLGGAAGQGGLNRGGGREGGFGQQAGGGIGDRGGQASPRTGGAGQGGFGQGGGGGSSAGAFEGVGGGRDAQSFSSRGNASRESFSRSSSSSGGARASSGSFSGGSRGGGGARAGAGGGGGARGGGGGRGGGGRR